MYLTQGLHRAIQQNPHGMATIMGERRHTWSTFIDRVARLANGLAALGVQPGDRVAPISLNSDRYIEVYFAVWWAGAIVVPGNTRWALAEHVYALRDSEASLLLLDKTFAEFGPALQEQCGISACVYMDDGAAPDGMVHMDDLIARHEPAEDRCGRGEDLCAIFYTGGTTGRSKGVMLSHRAIGTNQLSALATCPIASDAIYLHSAPMFHLADAAMLLAVTFMGATHVVLPFFTPEGVAQAITSEGVTEVLLVPTMIGMVAEYAAQHPVDFSTVRGVTYGAAPISEALLKQALVLFPNARFKQGYGQTELSPLATYLLPEFHVPSKTGKSYLRSAGRAIVGVDVRIVDEEMRTLPQMEVGEIAVRSPGAMTGYWKMPELTASTIVDGWVRTGDAGYMDEEGFVYLVDRVKDMIVTGGENVFSAEVENALAAHAAIAECAVIGIPHERWGEAVHAIVRLKAGSEATADELIVHCRDLIASYKVPKSVEIRIDPLPLSGAGKILKVELRKAYWPEGARKIG